MFEDRSTNRGATILAVDDDEQIQQVLREVLTKAGYDVQTAGSGKEALTMAGESEPDLILMDILMPDMDGYETTLQLKRHLSIEDTPVIFLSGRSEEEDRGRAFAVGASMFIRKPFTANEVRDIVDFALRSVQNPRVAPSMSKSE